MCGCVCVDSSDEEFVEDAEAAAAAGDESDMCSDLEEEEEGEREGSRGSRHSWSDEEEDGVNQSLLGKRKSQAARVLDSDDEDEDSLEKAKAGGDSVFAGRSLLDPMEGSMPPLRLDSIDDTNSPLSPASSHSPSHSPSHTSSHTSIPQPTQTLSLALQDSGIGQSQEDPVSRGEEELEGESEGEAEEEKRDEGSVSVVTDADSLEFSFQWGQSLPLAQPVNHDMPPTATHSHALLHGDTMDFLGEESQWQATPTAKSELLSQDADTQYLDEDG